MAAETSAMHRKFKMKSLLTLVASLVLLLTLGACDQAHKSNSSHVANHNGSEGTSEYKDFYQLVTANADCNDLAWIAGHCETDPSGSWGGNAGIGVCGDAAKSCRYAVAVRNQFVGCWPLDQTPGC